MNRRNVLGIIAAMVARPSLPPAAPARVVSIVAETYAMGQKMAADGKMWLHVGISHYRVLLSDGKVVRCSTVDRLLPWVQRWAGEHNISAERLKPNGGSISVSFSELPKL